MRYKLLKQFVGNIINESNLVSTSAFGFYDLSHRYQKAARTFSQSMKEQYGLDKNELDKIVFRLDSTGKYIVAYYDMESLSKNQYFATAAVLGNQWKFRYS